MVLIPNLSETSFDSVRVDLAVSGDELSEYLLEELSTGEFNSSPLFAVIDGERPICVALEFWCEMGPFDLQAILTLSYGQDPPEMQWADEPWTKSTIDDMVNALAIFLEYPTSLRLEASFSIDRSRVPPHSLVSSMIGLRTVAGEEQFLLSGAQFSIRGFPGDTISWFLPSWEEGKKLSGHVVRECYEKIHGESIADALYLAQARFNRMVLAQSEVKVHAAS